VTRIAARVAAALVCAPFALGPPPGWAQDSDQATGQGGSQGSGIVTEQLAPLTPQGQKPPQRDGDSQGDGGEPRGDLFKAAPFRGVTNPVAPALIEPVETEAAAGARLRQLDKMTGRTQTVEIAAGEEGMVDRLRIRVAACRMPADNATHGTMAFLQIWDTKTDAAEPAFSGWMFAESPALSALDHPRYDVWVISCTTSSGPTASGSE